MGIFSFSINLFFGQASLDQLFFFIVVPPLACIIAMVFSIPITSVIAITTFKRGLDPDIIVYPILASVNDIIVTASFVIIIFMIFAGGLFYQILIGLFALIIGTTGVLVWRNKNEQFFVKTLREGTTVAILSSLFGGFNGFFLSNMSKNLLNYPGIVVLYPALSNALGNIGSIIGSITTTSIALGYVKTFKEEVEKAIEPILQVEIVAFFMHLIFGVITFIILKLSNSSANMILLISVALVSNLSSFLIIAVFSLILAVISFKRGLNPDNVVIPLITTTSDTVATLVINPVLYIILMIGLF